MPPPARGSIELEPGTPIADAVTRGRAAFVRADAAGVDAAYQEAVGLAAGDSTLWSVLAADHVEQLRALRRATLALQRCNEYLRKAGANHVPLRVQRAEIRCVLGDHSGAGTDAAAIRTALGSQANSLTSDDSARLHRVEGLSAADRGDPDGAIRHLDAAWQIFVEVGDEAGVAAIALDRLRIDVREGEERAISDVLSGEPPQTVSDHLLRAMALRRQVRYEEALQVLLRGIVDDDPDPALRWPVLYELILLLRLIRQDGSAEELLPLLAEAADVSVDPPAAIAAAGRLTAAGTPSDAISPQYDRRVQHVRRLIIDERLDEAESLLIELRFLARTDRDISTWHLAAGELELARYENSKTRSFAQDAVGHLSSAADRASALALVEVKACALGLLGDACDVLGADDRAAECWAEAHRLEEHIAGRQINDSVRRGMLLPVPDEYDKRIRAAARALDGRGVEATPTIVVAMEAARGATILARILPDDKGLVRDLPRQSDLNGAFQWMSNIADGLPPSQAAWIMHSTPDRVHHAIIGEGFFYHTSVSAQREELEGAIDQLMTCWSEGAETLEHSIAGGQFDKWLEVIAAQVGIGAVIPEIPSRFRRIAIVAGDALSDIPFAAMTIPGETEPLGLRFALSDLPCLSARLPLHQRSRRQRGDRRLLVSPPDGLTRAADISAHTVLDGECATVAMLQAELKLHRHRLVRIDCHGVHEHDDATQSWLQFGSAGSDDGQLRAEELQWMDLHGCGTLVLGACESGMAQRIGRGERIGFVRAAIHAGAPAVIAARWKAEDSVAATVLDRFERYVRYLPRDLALQRAQLDVCRGAPGVPANIPAVDHPARWACWTLYGDSGWQTRAGLVRRWLRRSLDQRRRHAASP